MVAMSAFSGLMSSACAFASAAAIAPMVSLDRCMASLFIMWEKIKADRARLRSLGSNAVAGGFLGVLGQQGLELGLGPLVIEKGGARGAEEASELRPRIGLAHVDYANCVDPWPRRLDAIGGAASLRSERTARTAAPP